MNPRNVKEETHEEYQFSFDFSPKNRASKEELDDEIVANAVKILEDSINREGALTSPEKTKTYLRLKFAALEHEVFSILILDAKHRPINLSAMFMGTVDGASVYPREVLKEVLRYNGAAVILCHNHPSGSIKPSQADLAITKKLKEALNHIDVKVLDHIIVGVEGTTSLAEIGEM